MRSLVSRAVRRVVGERVHFVVREALVQPLPGCAQQQAVVARGQFLAPEDLGWLEALESLHLSDGLNDALELHPLRNQKGEVPPHGRHPWQSSMPRQAQSAPIDWVQKDLGDEHGCAYLAPSCDARFQLAKARQQVVSRPH